MLRHSDSDLTDHVYVSNPLYVLSRRNAVSSSAKNFANICLLSNAGPPT